MATHLDRTVDRVLFGYKLTLFGTALCITCIGLITSPAAQAQGFEVQPWNARTPTPQLQASDLNGKVWRLADFRGKVVLINFWASWCPPCLVEMPALQQLAATYGSEKLVVLAVNFKESSTVVRRYVQRSDLQLPVLLDSQGLMARQWGVTVFPTTVLVASDGRVRSVVRGEFDWSGPQASKWLQPLLAPAGLPQ